MTQSQKKEHKQKTENIVTNSIKALKMVLITKKKKSLGQKRLSLKCSVSLKTKLYMKLYSANLFYSFKIYILF